MKSWINTIKTRRTAQFFVFGFVLYALSFFLNVIDDSDSPIGYEVAFGFLQSIIKEVRSDEIPVWFYNNFPNLVLPFIIVLYFSKGSRKWMVVLPVLAIASALTWLTDDGIHPAIGYWTWLFGITIMNGLFALKLFKKSSEN